MECGVYIVSMIHTLHVTNSLLRRIVIVVSVLMYNCTLSVYDALVLWHDSSSATHYSVSREQCKATDMREELPIENRVFQKNTSSAVPLFSHFLSHSICELN